MIRMKKTALMAAIVLASCAAWLLASEPQRSPASGVLIIKDAFILPVSRPAFPKGSVLIREGKIAEIGPQVATPEGATVIDAKGQYVMPGIIDCHSHIAISGGVNEGTLAVTAMVGVEDVLNPDDINIYRSLAGGVTTANILHGSANPIGGRNQVIKLRWGKDAKGLIFEGSKPGIKFALGENPKRSRATPGTSPARYPQTRMGVEDVIRDALIEARTYIEKWDEYEKRAAAGDKSAIPPAKDLKLETLAEVLRGERLVHAHCYRADEILMLLRVADEFGFKIATFQHVLEGYKVAREIAAQGAGASTFSDWWGYKIEAVDAIPQNAALMTRKGVIVSVNSDSAEHARRLNTEAAKSIKWGGLTEDEALALVTINPARQLRVESRVGSLEVGKDADVVIWNHHPLSTYAIVDRVYIDGQTYYDRPEDQKRLTELSKEKDTLVAAERDERRNPSTTEEPRAES